MRSTIKPQKYRLLLDNPRKRDFFLRHVSVLKFDVIVRRGEGQMRWRYRIFGLAAGSWFATFRVHRGKQLVGGRTHPIRDQVYYRQWKD